MRTHHVRTGAAALLLILTAIVPAAAEGPKPQVGEKLERKGDEIVACGQFFHTGAPVVLWIDPGGYDAYRVEPRFATPGAPRAKEWEGARYGMRRARLSPEQVERIRSGGWDLPLLQEVVDQFVLHYDVCGTSRKCFQVLQDERHLSVHFMLDVDGTIYQTLDLKEAAWHATKANSRSVGVEIAQMGAYPVGSSHPLDRWYERGPDGRVRLTIPGGAKEAGVRNHQEIFCPARDEPILGTIQGQKLIQYDFTPQQYDSLIKLTATLCTILPKIRCDYPRDGSGQLIPRKLPDDQYDRYQGILGHYHVQTNKTDPGPALQWDKVIEGARALRQEAQNSTAKGTP
ncbi:MAG: N-acetylmuramoyl-L-alanine amidase [Isosphaeraceae bacterium]|nr:N-acetylmuramoyl-L-alanine amidase [Isosphaeraceae bacterium]